MNMQLLLVLLHAVILMSTVPQRERLQWQLLEIEMMLTQIESVIICAITINSCCQYYYLQ